MHDSPKIAAQDASSGQLNTPSPLSGPRALPPAPNSDSSSFTPPSSVPSRRSPLASSFSRADDPGPSNRNYTFESQSNRSFTSDFARYRSVSSATVNSKFDGRALHRKESELSLPRRLSSDSASPTLLVQRPSKENPLSVNISGTSSSRPRTGTLSTVDERIAGSVHTRSDSSSVSDAIIFNMDDITQTMPPTNDIYGASSSNMLGAHRGLDFSSYSMIAAPRDQSSSELWRTDSRPHEPRNINVGLPSGSSLVANYDPFSLRGGVDAGDGFSSGSVSSSIPSTFDLHLRQGSLSSSSDLQHTRTSLMNFDGLENTVVCHIGKNGNVVAATLAGLVDKLLKKSSANATSKYLRWIIRGGD